MSFFQDYQASSFFPNKDEIDEDEVKTYPKWVGW